MARRNKSRRSQEITEREHQELLATLARMINAWEKHAPNKKFAGMSLEDFRKAVQPSFDADAEVTRLECEMQRLKELLGEEDFQSPVRH